LPQWATKCYSGKILWCVAEDEPRTLRAEDTESLPYFFSVLSVSVVKSFWLRQKRPHYTGSSGLGIIMAKCRFCHKYIPDGIVRCPHCQASLQASSSTKGGTISPFEVRARAARDRRQPAATKSAGGLPASRLALFGCLGLVALLLMGAIVFALVAPDAARSLLFGPPTPLPPTPRPTLTPSPIPSPTPKWESHQGAKDSYTVSFPPYWVVIDFTDPNWEKILRRESFFYSWLERRLPEEMQQESVSAQAIWAFDPRRMGAFAIHCRLEPDLAGMTAAEIRNDLGDRLLEIPASLGGRVQGGARVEMVEIDDQPAVFFELLMRPGADSFYDQPVQLRFYLLADEEQGYWIEVVGIEDELDEDALLIQTALDNFHLPGQRGGQQEDD